MVVEGMASRAHARLSTLKQLALSAPVVSDWYIRRRIENQFMASRTRGILPRHLAIETVAHCNAACIMCPYPTLQRKKGIMTADVHRLIVDKVAAWGAPIKFISHAGMGEPLVDKRIAEKIVYEKSVLKDAEVAVFTNASLLDRKRAIELIESGVDRISVSLNGFTKETYEAVMKLPYERTYENVHGFLDLRRELGAKVRFHVSLIPTEVHTREEVEKFKSYWKERADAVSVPPWITWGGYFDPKTRKRQWPCRYVWEVMQIDWDGTVKMCCEDYESKYPMGNLTTQGPNEVFNSPRMFKQRADQVAGDFRWPDACLNCVESHEVARDFWKTADIVLAQAPSAR